MTEELELSRASFPDDLEFSGAAELVNSVRVVSTGISSAIILSLGISSAIMLSSSFASVLLSLEHPKVDNMKKMAAGMARTKCAVFILIPF